MAKIYNALSPKLTTLYPQKTATLYGKNLQSYIAKIYNIVLQKSITLYDKNLRRCIAKIYVVASLNLRRCIAKTLDAVSPKSTSSYR